ncbi:MAG: hypothetical protein DWQ36_22950 [Acidobacteria bacterium]|nr:MAG: hypothetical protein DWQ30_21375 [Acidobacteriota bacterium]REK00493.1 MAG: hypothetical protein DWQ36_22950 [Acidobacteriota bacterium]
MTKQPPEKQPVAPTSVSGRRYPRLETVLPANLHARLHAAATVLGRSAEEIVERALEKELADLTTEQRELVDRLAASVIQRSDL